MIQRAPDTAAPSIRANWLEAFLIAACLSLAVVLAPRVLADDAAISFRYANRLAAGRGFTYNDHERVQGASNPLYVLILAAVRPITSDLEKAARVLGWICLGVSMWLAMRIAADLAESRLAGLAAPLLLTLDFTFRYHVQSGLEAGLTVVLGLAAVRAVQNGSMNAAGWLLGLALVNKLDAGLLVVAVAIAIRVTSRKWPVPLLVRAAVPLGLWMSFATMYFGTPLPNSLLVKLTASGQPFDRWSVVRVFSTSFYWILPALALVSTVIFRARATAIALLLWFLLGVAVLTLVDFGAAYPWYRVPLFPPCMILAVSVLGWCWRRRRQHQAFAVAAVAPILLALYPMTALTVSDFRERNNVRSWERMDGDRRRAGALLARESSADEIVESAYGWVAYPIGNPFVDTTGLNTVKRPGQPTYRVNEFKAGDPIAAPDGFERLAVFDDAHRHHPDMIWFALSGRPTSSIARSGRRAILLVETIQASRSASLGCAKVAGGDLDTCADGEVSVRIPDSNGERWLEFTPVVSAQPSRDPLAVTIDVLSNGRSISRLDLASREALEFASIPVPPGTGQLTIRTTSSSQGTRVVLRLPRIAVGPRAD